MPILRDLQQITRCYRSLHPLTYFVYKPCSTSASYPGAFFGIHRSDIKVAFSYYIEINGQGKQAREDAWGSFEKGT